MVRGPDRHSERQQRCDLCISELESVGGFSSHLHAWCWVVVCVRIISPPCGRVPTAGGTAGTGSRAHARTAFMCGSSVSEGAVVLRAELWNIGKRSSSEWAEGPPAPPRAVARSQTLTRRNRLPWLNGPLGRPSHWRRSAKIDSCEVEHPATGGTLGRSWRYDRAPAAVVAARSPRVFRAAAGSPGSSIRTSAPLDRAGASGRRPRRSNSA